jgi:hypothetical protein
MAKAKKERVQELYQILDQFDKPIRIRIGFQSTIINSRVGKIYQSKSAAITAIRKAIGVMETAPSQYRAGMVFDLYGKRISKDEWIESLLKMKIRVFQPVAVEELTFHLDKLK